MLSPYLSVKKKSNLELDKVQKKKHFHLHILSKIYGGYNFLYNWRGKNVSCKYFLQYLFNLNELILSCLLLSHNISLGSQDIKSWNNGWNQEWPGFTFNLFINNTRRKGKRIMVIFGNNLHLLDNYLNTFFKFPIYMKM